MTHTIGCDINMHVGGHHNNCACECHYEQRYREYIQKGVPPITGILPQTDELMERYYRLAFAQEIPNIARYAFEWQVLAEDAAKAGRPACAEAWGERGRHYAQQAGGEYIRLIEGSFAELIQTAPAPAREERITK